MLSDESLQVKTGGITRALKQMLPLALWYLQQAPGPVPSQSAPVTSTSTIPLPKATRTPRGPPNTAPSLTGARPGAGRGSRASSASRGAALTCTLLIQLRTAVKEHSAVTSYITRMPSAFRKYCLVMLRNLSPTEPQAPSEPQETHLRNRRRLSGFQRRLPARAMRPLGLAHADW